MPSLLFFSDLLLKQPTSPPPSPHPCCLSFTSSFSCSPVRFLLFCSGTDSTENSRLSASWKQSSTIQHVGSHHTVRRRDCRRFLFFFFSSLWLLLLLLPTKVLSLPNAHWIYSHLLAPTHPPVKYRDDRCMLHGLDLFERRGEEMQLQTTCDPDVPFLVKVHNRMHTNMHTHTHTHTHIDIELKT